QDGPVKLWEAVDDKEQSLLPPAGSQAPNHSSYMVYNQGQMLFQLQSYLHYPAQPGKTIKRLRGMVPLSVAARKADPLTIPLADAAGKTFRQGEVSVTVHSVKAGPQQPATTIELTVRSGGSGGAP